MIESLIKYSQQLGFQDLENRLVSISETLNNGHAELIIPLVGEFSAGKTTLINSLTDSKALECASRPTTATIYTIHFGADDCHAIVHNQDGTTTNVPNISDLKNDSLQNAVVVDVFDTSKSVPESIVIVDTPGLSSQDIKHKQTLVDFLPNADAILLVSDINQQITRSLSDFAKTIALSNRPIYLVFTQCDTKSKEDVRLAKEYLLKNTELPLSGVVCVSAKTNDLSELHQLLTNIQQDKTAILKKVNEFRCKEIASEILARIDTLIDSSNSDEALNEAIHEQQLKLNKIKRQISNLTETISSELGDIQRNIIRNFEDKIFEKLDTVVANKSCDYDTDAMAAINNTASLLLNDYKSQVLNLLASKTQSKEDFNGISIESIKELDLSGMTINGLSYNLNLNELGHEYDKKIATGLKIAAVAATVAVAAGAAAKAAGAAAGGGASAAGGGAKAGTAALAVGSLPMMANMADTLSDVGSMISNKRHADRINKMIQYGEAINDKLGKANEFDASAGQRMGQNKGIVESLVGFFTEKAMGKPQRRRAIHEYIDSTLSPTFSSELQRITTEINHNVSDFLTRAAEMQTSELTASLESLKQSRQEQQNTFDAKIKEFKEIKKNLLNL